MVYFPVQTIQPKKEQLQLLSVVQGRVVASDSNSKHEIQMHQFQKQMTKKLTREMINHMINKW